MSATCKTCRHYKPESCPGPYGEVLGQCMHPKLNNGGYLARDGLLPTDEFWTGPDFGCLHHENLVEAKALLDKFPAVKNE